MYCQRKLLISEVKMWFRKSVHNPRFHVVNYTHTRKEGRKDRRQRLFSYYFLVCMFYFSVLGVHDNIITGMTKKALSAEI